MKNFILILAAFSFTAPALAVDQGINAREKSEQAEAQKVKAMIAKVTKYNELYGDEGGPSTEEECITEYSSQVEISACREMLGLRRSVVSSRHVIKKKMPRPQGSGDLDKPSMDFKTE